MFGCLNFLVVLFVLFVEIYILCWAEKRTECNVCCHVILTRCSVATTPKRCRLLKILRLLHDTVVDEGVCQFIEVLQFIHVNRTWFFAKWFGHFPCMPLHQRPLVETSRTCHRNNSSNYYQDEWLHCCEKGDGIFKTLLVFVHRWVGWK